MQQFTEIITRAGPQFEQAEMNVLSLKCLYHNSVFSWIMSIRISYTNVTCMASIFTTLLLGSIHHTFAYLSVLTCYNRFLSHMVFCVDWGTRIVGTVFRTLQTLEMQYSFLP